MSRILLWFQTKNGRNFTRCCVGAAAAIAVAGHVVPNGPGLSMVQKICQVYADGKPTPLSPKMNSILEQVLKDCNLEEDKKKKLSFFYGVGHETFHAGGTDSPWGAIIGVPFTFENIEDINFGGMKILGKEKVDWVIDGHDLVAALTLSDDAKKFALMREIYSVNFFRHLENGIMNSAIIVLIAQFIRAMNIKFKVFERYRFSGRSLYYLTLHATGFLIFQCLKDPIKHLSDMKADKMAAETGPDYLNGGIEYYKKVLSKNKALRDLPNSEFKSSIDPKGNTTYFIFAPKLPISKRLDTLLQLKKDKI